MTNILLKIKRWIVRACLTDEELQALNKFYIKKCIATYYNSYELKNFTPDNTLTTLTYDK
jgi:hypothetical protein